MSPAQIIDACVLINLLATGELKSILDSVGRTSLICSVVREESIYLKTGGTLSVCELEGEKEELSYVDFASVLDDGEAMTLAIAINRGLYLVTDERKARRLFSEQVGNPKRLISTSDLIYHWAQGKKVRANKLQETLQKIESRASYRPPTTDRNQKWWIKALS